MGRASILLTLCLGLFGLLAAALWTAAGADEEADKSSFVRFVEDTISTPDMRISLGRIDGALSSDVRISSISIADREGVWLKIENVHLIWSRLALLSKRLDIDLLEAQAITLSRKPVQAGGLQPAASPFALPELPVSVRITKLDVPRVWVDASIAGEATTLAVSGGADLAEGKLKADVAIERTQPAGGRLALKADYGNETRRLDLDLTLDEPKNGFLSNLLNLPDRPSLAFRIVGSGPLDAFRATIGLSADDRSLLDGTATISRGTDGLDFAADLKGTLGPLVQPAYADFFAGTSQLAFGARQDSKGGLTVDRADIKSGVLAVSMKGAFAQDGFPTRLTADGHVGADDNRPILLPGAGGASVGASTFTASFGDGQWAADFELSSLKAGAVAAGNANIHAGGEARDLDNPQARAITFAVAGRASAIAATDPAVQRALGSSADLSSSGRWQSGQPVDIDEIRLSNTSLIARFVGKLSGNDLDGNYALATPDLSALAGLTGGTPGGKVDLTATGRVALIGGAFALHLAGTSDNLSLGLPAIDPLLAGRLELSGSTIRDVQGLHFDKVALSGPDASVRLQGLYGARTSSLDAVLSIADVASITDRARGKISAMLSLAGVMRSPSVRAVIEAPLLDLQGKRLVDGRAAFEGTLPRDGPSGTFSASGSLDGVPLTASAALASLADGTKHLSGFDARLGGASIAGDMSVLPSTLVTGHVQVDGPSIGAVAPLFLVKASGSLKADIMLDVAGTAQDAAIKADVEGLTVETVQIGSAHADIKAGDIFGTPSVVGTMDGRDISLGSFRLTDLKASAMRRADESTAFEANAALPRGSIRTGGSLRKAGDGFDLTLSTLSLKQDGLAADLSAPVTIASRSTGLAVPRAELRMGRGASATVQGTIGDRLSLDVTVASVPASLANMVSPTLDASGTLSGSARITGSTAIPVADFQLSGAGLTARVLQETQVPPLRLDAKGRYANRSVTLDATVTGAKGLSFRTEGIVPLAGPGLALSIKGSVPLGLADVFLRDRGGQVTGTLTLDASVTGSPGSPAIRGSAGVSGASLTDPETGTKISNLVGLVRFNGATATIERLTGGTTGGGTVSADGSIGLKGDFPAALGIRLRDTRVSDGRIVTAQVSGDLTLRGPLAGQPTIAGRIMIARAEITIPERFPTNAALLGIKHLAAPREVLRTLARARSARGGAAASRKATGFLVDLTIDAPSKLFVRGRGIDAELGGSVTLRGPVSSPSPVGSFQLRRGALEVIGQTIKLERGSVRLVGDLDPIIDFTATTRSRSIAVSASVTGQASDPQIVLSSVPELPQDEVLAQFLFGHSINDLSPLQIVQLATAVAQLAGGSSGPGLLASIRKSTGLDTLGIVTDAQGNAAVQAGRYVSEKVYLGVATGAGGQTNATVNLDITRNLKARAEAGTGGAGAGIFYEREY